jgi:hypothetical protein
MSKLKQTIVAIGKQEEIIKNQDIKLIEQQRSLEELTLVLAVLTHREGKEIRISPKEFRELPDKMFSVKFDNDDMVIALTNVKSEIIPQI